MTPTQEGVEGKEFFGRNPKNLPGRNQDKESREMNVLPREIAQCVLISVNGCLHEIWSFRYRLL